MAHWSPDLPPAEVYAWGDERLDGLVRAVNDAPEVALDTETTGLNNMRDHAVIWSLAFGRRRICMKADTLRAFDRTFRDPSRTWIFHNAKFDAHMLANLGFTIAGRWLDTAVMHALLYEETSHKLKDVHKQMFGWSWAGFKQTFGNFPESETARVLYENWDNARQKVVEYASNDAYGTLNVKTKLYDELEKELVFSLFPDEYPNMLAIYEKTEAPFTKVLWKCERAGMKVDFDYLQTIADPVNEELARVQRETTRLAGELVNIDSPAQLRRLFFDKLKLTPTHYTKGGKKGIREPSTDADFLEANADHPICASILRERELGKLKGTYIDTLPTLVDQYRRMHPTYNQDVARCMPAGELVLTNRGYIPVEQVAVGDLVLSHMGVPRAVIELSRHAPAMVYLICFANGNTLRTTGNHEYLTPTGWVRADALRPGDTVIAHTNAEEWSTPAAWDADAPGRRPPATFGETKVVTWMATYPRETYGLTVDIDHSHVTGGLVTHNTGRLSAKNPNCFHPDTEFLTRDGWVRCEDLQEGVEVAEYRPDGTIAFVQPTAHYVFEVDKLVSLRNQHTRLLVTEEHRCLLRHRKTGALRVFHAKDYPEDWQQIHAGTYTSSTHENQLLRADGAPWSAAFIRLILATQADGTYDKSGAISFAFKKERKTRRLLEILTALGAQHTYHVDSYGRARIRLPKQPLVEELQRIMPEKVLGAWVLQLLPWQLNELCDEVVFWDGSWSRKNSYASKDPRNASWVQLAFTLTNRRAHWRVYRAKKRLSYQVDVTQRDDSMTTNIKKETVPYKGKVYCVSVPSTFVLTRLEGQISITGQSQNFPNTDNDKFGIRGAFTCEPGNTLIVIDYCLAPGTRLLHSDLTWKRIDETSVGDELIGFDEELRGSKFKRTRVTSVKHLERPCITVVTDRGTVTASTEHLWVVRPASGDRANLRRWVRTDELQPGDRISFFVPPWETDRSYGAGYLAGAYDGEGWVHQSRVSFAQNEGVVLDRTTDLLRERGFETYNDDTLTCRRRTIANGDALRFLGTIRPARLLPRAAQMWEGRRTWGRNSRPATVLRVEGKGVQSVVAVGTTSRTFIAEGFLSHNCALEMRLLAAAAGEPDMLRIFQEGKDIHMGNASMVFGLPYEDLVKAKKTDKLVKEGKLPPEEMTEYFRECLRRRSQVKSVGFGMNYGLKENKLAQQLGITKDEALDLMRRYMERYPTVEHFYKSAIESCKETCRAYSILGRRRYLPEIWSNKSMIRWQAERRAVNMEIQGGAADVVRLAMLACDALDLEGEHGCYMLAQIHDELVFECPIEEAEEAKGKIIQAMMHPFPKDLPVTLEVSAGTGPNWRDAK